MKYIKNLCISHVLLMYYSCILAKYEFKSGIKKAQKTANTCTIHVIYMRFPLQNPIFNVFLMYFKKNQCIFRLREIGKNHMYFTCISHVFSCIFNVFIKFIKNIYKKSMYFSCISHVFLMY